MNSTIKMFLCVVIALQCSFAQVLSNAKKVQTGLFNIGLAPVIFVRGDNDVGFHVSGSYGIMPQADIGFHFLLDDAYSVFGGDVSWLISGTSPLIIGTLGGHVARGTVGIDGTLMVTFPIRTTFLYLGLDNNFDFEGANKYKLWGVFGMETYIKHSLSMLLEIDVDIADSAWSMFCIGIGIYF